MSLLKHNLAVIDICITNTLTNISSPLALKGYVFFSVVKISATLLCHVVYIFEYTESNVFLLALPLLMFKNNIFINRVVAKKHPYIITSFNLGGTYFFKGSFIVEHFKIQNCQHRKYRV